MKIKRLRIENFKSIQLVELCDLKSSIVIAGSNGSGKSTIFSAIRLIKSAYGQYIKNEYARWFEEFGIDIKQSRLSFDKIAQNETLPITIEADFVFAQDELEYIAANAEVMFESLQWSQLLRRQSEDGDTVIANPTQRQADQKLIRTEANLRAQKVREVLRNETHNAKLIVKPHQLPTVSGSPLLELAFSVFEPNHIGVVEYQPPSRVYDREEVNSVNLRIGVDQTSHANQALQNSAQKYRGVKAQMAQSYVSDLIAEKAGVELKRENSLDKTLNELFRTFFPGKEFLGPVPSQDGRLTFPIRLEDGSTHDLNELSSGEKEVLLGYLRLRNYAPKNSVLLFDEPELHLNPKLSRGLPRFYERNIARVNNNQLWMVTHSDAILREAVQEPDFNVYHMRSASQVDIGENQLTQLTAAGDIEGALIDLVGDLATYSPRSKVVLLEGSDSEIDARIVNQLFPSFSEKVNLVSLGSKKNVSLSHDILDKAAEDGRLDARFFSIVDRDYDPSRRSSSFRRFEWDRYHIENYLLEESFIAKALEEVSVGALTFTELEVENKLREAAEQTVDELVRIRLQKSVNEGLVGSISLGYNKGAFSTVEGLSNAIVRSREKFSKNADQILSSVKQDAADLSVELRNALQNGTWKNVFRGRNVLQRFSNEFSTFITYEQLRNLIVARMREAGFAPSGMSAVIAKIEAIK